MICIDNQPYSMVEDQGFKRLMSYLEPRYNIPSRKYFSTKLIPQLYEKTKVDCGKKFVDIKWVSFTTDMWSSLANDDFLSLTGHFVNSAFELEHIFLEVIPFTFATHTAANIKSFLQETLVTWNLTEKVNIFVRDNGRNIVAAMDSAGYVHVPCLAHTLQLVIKDGCLGSKVVANVTSICRRLVCHFKHSCHANKVLREAQACVGLPNKKLKQDEPTRWDSTYNMLNRLIEQRAALSIAATKLNLPVELTSGQWHQIGAIISILEIFQKATKAISSASITLSEVIPIVNSLKYDLERVELEKSGLQGIRNDLLASLKERYKEFETEVVYSTATILDPRFKDQMFSQQNYSKSAIENAIEQLSTLAEHEPTSTTNDSNCASTSQSSAATTSEGPVWAKYKRAKVVVNEEATPDEENLIRSEMEEYLREPLLENNVNVFHYWKMSRFTRIKRLVPKYLGTPLSTVFSERLFSTAGIICDRKRSSMKPETVQKLVFLNKNLHVSNVAIDST